MKNVNIIKIQSIYFFLGIFTLYANALKFINKFAIVYYPSFFILCALTLILSFKKANKLNIEILIFLVVCLLSLLFNTIKQEYNLYFRLISYSMLLYIFGPLITNTVLDDYRKRLFYYITITLEIIVYIGIILLLIPGLGYGRGGFTGSYIHSMIASPFFAITTLHFIANYQIHRKKIIMLSALISLILTIYSASRISIFGLILSISMFYLNFYKKSIPKAVCISIFSILLLILLIYLIRILFPSLFINVENKIYNRTFYESKRYYLLDQRIYEYKNNPIIGVGFSNSLFEETINSNTGKVEPGSSWLFILSTMGTLGLISFLYIYIKSVFICLKISNANDSSLLMSILLFYGIHMCMEGYILASGSPLTIYFWLLISQIYSKQYKFENIEICKKNETYINN